MNASRRFDEAPPHEDQGSPSMDLLWPESLWLMLALPLLPVAYLRLLRRRRRAAVRYSGLHIAREAARGLHWRRHLPPALLWLACAGLLLAAARPVARVPLPWARSTILLAMDVSLSMRVTDVQPTRFAAAQEAAKVFLHNVPRRVEVGLVTFAGSAHVARRATLDRASLVTAIEGFQMQMGTAVGDAIVLCLAELFPDEGIDVGDAAAGSQAPPLARAGKAGPPVTPVAPGSHAAAAVILLSDGRRTMGIETLEAARMAADRGVRIYVVGLGTAGDALTPEGMSIYVQLDEPTLREVARMTGGAYYHAGTAGTLRSVYEDLGSRVEVQARETELTGLLSFASALLALVAGGLSVLWFARIA